MVKIQFTYAEHGLAHLINSFDSVFWRQHCLCACCINKFSIMICLTQYYWIFNSIDAFCQLLDLSWMHRQHMEGLQVTRIRSINYSEFHNCFGAVWNGPDWHIWQLWLHWYILAVAGFILDEHKVYGWTASDRNQIYQSFRVS